MEKMPTTTGNSILLAKKQEYMPQKITYLGEECTKPRPINIICDVLATPSRKNLLINHQRTEVPTLNFCKFAQAEPKGHSEIINRSI